MQEYGQNLTGLAIVALAALVCGAVLAGSAGRARSILAGWSSAVKRRGRQRADAPGVTRRSMVQWHNGCPDQVRA